jgi:hypothetical protein
MLNIFRKVCLQQPEVAVKVIKVLGHRLRHLERLIRKPGSTNGALLLGGGLGHTGSEGHRLVNLLSPKRWRDAVDTTSTHLHAQGL